MSRYEIPLAGTETETLVAIEEIARHAGHADLIRESIDGEVGDFRDE